ncbi:MAG: SLBB domain-containing protein, partial [Candidatus Margulisiibacteriota bacterium]
RIKEGKSKLIFNLKFDSLNSFKESLKNVTLADGDLVTVLPISEKVKNYVTLEGNVERQGNFQFKKGLTLAKLIQMADGFSAGSYLNRIEIYRYLSDDSRKIIAVNYLTSEGKNFLLADLDMVKIYSNQEVTGEQFVDIDGGVTKPGTYLLYKNMKVADLAFLAQINKSAKLDQVEIYRHEVSKEPQIITINLTKAMQNSNSTENVLLINGDKVTIRLGFDETMVKKIEISGEVRYPGTYFLTEKDRLSTLIERAGGFTSRAFLFGAVLKRESVKNQEQSGETRVIVQEQKRLMYDQSLNNIQNKSSLQEAIQYLSKEVDINSGRLLITLKPLAEFKNSNDDLYLENADILYIPPIPSSVQIIGGVINPNAVTYCAGKDVGYYVNIAGGYNDFADKNGIFIIQANGNISRDLSKVTNGDVIYIPERIKKEIDWVQAIVQTSATITQILTSFAILKTIGLIK